MAAPQLSSILDRQAGDAERPKPLPVGTYRAIVLGAPRFDKSSKKGTDYVEFTLKFQSAEEDVDEDDLKSALTKKSGETIALNQKTARLTFYLTEDAVYRLDEFFKHCGLDIEETPMSRRQAAAEIQNSEVLVHLKHVPSEDGESVYANIDKTAAVG
jgi:hypothetical protein